MKNKSIVEAINLIDIPQADSEKIYKRIIETEGTQRHYRAKKPIALIAAVILIILAAGSVYAAQIIANLVSVKDKSAEADMTGNINIIISEYEAYDSYIDVPLEYNEEWLRTHSSTTVAAVASDGESTTVFGLTGNIKDKYESVISLTAESNTVVLPSCIPEGFSFKHALYTLYITEDELKNAESNSAVFVENEYVHQSYNLPQSVKKNIRELIIVFENSKGKTLTYTYQLSFGDNVVVGANPNASAKKVQVFGFENAVVVSDESRFVCAAVRSIAPISYCPDHSIGALERERIYGFPALSDNSAYFDNVICTVSSDSIQCSDLLNILENLE